MKNDVEIKHFVQDEEDIRPDLSPRDALFGGRTNAAILYYKIKQDERIEYVDFTSVYPSVMKMCSFPVGFPVVMSENFTNVKRLFWPN